MTRQLHPLPCLRLARGSSKRTGKDCTSLPGASCGVWAARRRLLARAACKGAVAGWLLTLAGRLLRGGGGPRLPRSAAGALPLRRPEAPLGRLGRRAGGSAARGPAGRGVAGLELGRAGARARDKERASVRAMSDARGVGPRRTEE